MWSAWQFLIRVFSFLQTLHLRPETCKFELWTKVFFRSSPLLFFERAIFFLAACLVASYQRNTVRRVEWAIKEFQSFRRNFVCINSREVKKYTSKSILTKHISLYITWPLETCSCRQLYVILGRYFGGWKFIIIYFFNWQTEKNPVLDQ